MQHFEAYSEPCQTCKIEVFAKIVIFAKDSLLNVWQGFEYTPDIYLPATEYNKTWKSRFLRNIKKIILVESKPTTFSSPNLIFS